MQPFGCHGYYSLILIKGTRFVGERPVDTFVAVVTSQPCVLFYSGGDRQDHEDEKEDDQRCPPDRAGGDPQEHVHPSPEDDQGADRVAHREQVHEERRRQSQHFHLPSLMDMGRRGTHQQSQGGVSGIGVIGIVIGSAILAILFKLYLQLLSLSLSFLFFVPFFRLFDQWKNEFDPVLV